MSEQLKNYLEDSPGHVPFTTLIVICGAITFGGRITDKWDQRTNMSILRKLFCEELVLDDGYRLCEADEYFAPEEGGLKSIRDYIDDLPINDPPEIFGLHPNADITCVV